MTRLSLALTAASLLSASSAFVPHPHQQSQRSKAAAFVVLAAKPKVFIDGEAGTTGLQVRDRLAKRDDLEIISAPDELRKDEATRKSLINEADAVILCTLLLVFVYFHWSSHATTKCWRNKSKACLLTLFSVFNLFALTS